MSAFVPRGQAGEESQRLTRESELQAGQAREASEAERASRPCIINRILRKLRRKSEV